MMIAVLRLRLLTTILCYCWYAAIASAAARFYEAPDETRNDEGRYIVVLNQDVTESVAAIRDRLLENASSNDLVAERVFQTLKGFSLQVKDDVLNIESQQTLRAQRRQKLESILADPLVDFVEEVRLFSTRSTQQNCATFGIDRLNQRELPLDQIYTYELSGAGVSVYIIDSGIRPTHEEFSGREVTCGFNAFDDNFIHLAREDCNDYNGHGTHVAGTVGGKTYGVAKNVDLITVKVLNKDGNGQTDGVLAGIEWAVEHASQQDTPGVANLSLGGSYSEALNRACASGFAKGLFVTVAAGNEDQDACNTSPSSSIIAMTVGATNRQDFRASFSNYGRCVDIFAPGVDITSASHCSDTEVAILSGTSMASPHVAGVAALYYEEDPTASALVIKQRILRDATEDIVKLANDSPNLLVTSVVVNNVTVIATTQEQCVLPKETDGCDPKPDDCLSWWAITLIVVVVGCGLVFCLYTFGKGMFESGEDQGVRADAELEDPN